MTFWNEAMIPGQVVPVPGELEFNAGRASVTLIVENVGDRPIQVGSHYHFAATNPALSFDRAAARGFRLDIPAGTSTRFEPGITTQVRLVALAGARRVPGLRLDSGPDSIDAPGADAPRADAPRADAPGADAPEAGASGADAPGTGR